jgi:PAS domain S-box-containing protein
MATRLTRLTRIRPGLNIRAKLLISFMLVAMFTGALGLNAVITGYHLNTSRDALYSQVLGGTRLLAAWVDQSRVSEAYLSAYVLEQDPVARAGIRAKMAAADSRLAELAATTDSADSDGTDLEYLDALSQAWRDYTDWRDQSVLAPLDAGQLIEARAAFRSENGAHSAAINRAVNAFSDGENAAALVLEDSADAEANLQELIAIGLTIGAMVLALLVGYFLARDIARTAGQVATAAKGLAVGDLHQHVTVHSRDELGQMADAVRSMIAYQHELAEVASAMASGDLSHDITPKGETDVLGIAFGEMTANLRTFVRDLQEQTTILSAQAQLLDLASDAIIVRDIETSRIVFWSRGAGEMYGWRPDEALGQTTHTLLLTRFAESAAAVDAELLRTGRWDGELVHTRRDGLQLVIASRQAVQHDQAGRPVAVLHINTNITDRKRTEEDHMRLAAEVEHERTTLASVLASMTDGLIIVDQDRRISFCNATAAALLGTTLEIVVGNTVADLFALQRSLLVDPDGVWEGVKSELPQRSSYEIVFKGPPQRHVLLQRFAIGETGTVGTLLHDQSTERTLVRAKDELVSMVSHELASPATSLVAYAGLLAEHDYSEAERRDMLATMVQEGQRLTTIIQDFLDIQRLEHGRFQLTARRMDLRSLLEHAARVAGTDAEHPLTVEIPQALALVQADPNRVQQVLANLLSNARKYTPAGGRIWLIARQVVGAIETSVVDEGLGIPPSAIAHVFEKFYRVDADDRQLIKGTGLGLAIVKEIVEALGGRIGVESGGPGRGSRFWFTLPLAAASGQEPTGEVERSPAVAWRPPRIGALDVLVVDDDAAIRTTVRRALRPDGHRVILAESAEEALGFLRAGSFDIVLTDLGLGAGMDGWELAGRIRLDWPRVRVIVASGRVDIDADEARIQGVAAVLSKPYQVDDLRRIVLDVGATVGERAAA